MSAVTLPGNLSHPVAGPILAPYPSPHDWHGLIEAHDYGEWLGVVLLDVDRDGCATVWRPGQTGLHYRPTGVLRLPMDRDPVMDLAARWLARAVGLTVGHTAPEWVYYADPVGPWWRIRGAGGEVVFFASAAYPWTARTTAGARLVVVPGISALTNPAEALRLACLAVAQ